MAHAPEDVMKMLKNDQFAPVYFLQGEEPFFIDQLANYIEEHSLLPAEKSFNLHVFYGKDIPLRTVLEYARRFPMMARRQVIVVKEAQELSDFKQQQEALARYCEKPVDTTILVLAHKHKKIDGRSALAKAVEKHAVLVTSDPIRDYQLPGWISKYCQGQKIGIGERAASLLADHIGTDLSRIVNEIQKIQSGHPDLKELTEEMIGRYVGVSREYNLFELQKALATRNHLKAQQIVRYFDANPKSVNFFQLLSSLYNYFSKIVLVHAHAKEGKPAVMGKLGLANHKSAEFVYKEYQAAATNYPLPKALAALTFLHEADLLAKGVDGSAETGALMQELVFKIIFS